jgi:type II secretory pathway component GspD/PulD (secretin)
LLGWLFKDQTRRYNQSDLLLVVRPRVVRLPAAEVDPSITLRVGPESRPIPAL